MSNVSALPQSQALVLDPKIQESIVLRSDLSGLDQNQKKEYYLYRCKQIGLDPAAKPFDLLKLNGKEVLYANASCTQQLCSIHRLSTQITHRERMDDIFLVSVRVTGADGRVSENAGAVAIGNVKGDALANSILKATTKAIRRAVLAHCGLGMLDETEVETIPDAVRVSPMVPTHVPKDIQNLDKDTLEAELDGEPAQGIVLMVPGQSDPYSKHKNNEEWMDALLKMVDRIGDSKKLSGGDKLTKLEQLEKCNDFVLGIVREENQGLWEVYGNAVGKHKQRIALELRNDD